MINEGRGPVGSGNGVAKTIFTLSSQDTRANGCCVKNIDVDLDTYDSASSSEMEGKHASPARKGAEFDGEQGRASR